MSARNFTIDLRNDGSARLSLSYKGARQHGISRISCEMPPKDLVQLVLFEASISLHNALGTFRRIELALDGLVIKYGSGDTGLLSFDRYLGFSSQTAYCPLQEFHSGIAEAMDVCLARAETSKHGPLLKDILAQCAVPEGLFVGMEPDAADHVLHRLREMTLLILADKVTTKGSALARELRGMKTRPQAVVKIELVLDTLVHEFADAPNVRRNSATRLT